MIRLLKNIDKFAGAIVLFGLVAACFTESKAQTSKPEQPNIILFLVDDLGWQDTSVPFSGEKTPFNEIYRTPNMDRLARNGTTFTNAYSASPVCTPTRVSIMTGKNPARSNITNWTFNNDVEAQETAPKRYPLRSPRWEVSGLQPGDVSLPSLLKEKGYRTIHVGKAHFGAFGTPGADPTKLGFEVNIAGHAAGMPGSYYGWENFMRNSSKPSTRDVPGLEEYHGKDINLTRALTFEANEAIEESVKDGKPFFMNMAHYAVHTPIMADSGFVPLYPELSNREAAYASMIQSVDASLGTLLDKLKHMDIARETLILFMSDNGGLSAHSRGVTVAGTRLNMHNLPLRSGKGSAYEGGIRVPMIAAWAQPDSGQQAALSIPEGHRSAVPVISHDLFPTILDMAGGEIADDYQKDGKSLVSLMTNNSNNLKERALYWHYPHKWGPVGPGLDPFTAIRKGKWKLIYFYNDKKWELYNLNNDLSETRQLTPRRQTVAQELSGQMLSWMKRVDAQLPIDKRDGKPVEMPAYGTSN